MSVSDIKPVAWVGSSYKDFRAFPEPVQDTMGYALYLAQTGRIHERAKPLKGFGGAGVVELVDDHDRNTYRAVYSVKFAHVIYVLHAFQKKSKRGMRTSESDIDLIRRRLKVAEADHRRRMQEGVRDDRG
jgi:phage-related protein